MIANCMKCHNKEAEVDPKEKVPMKNGTIMVKGVCKACGKGACRIMKKEDADKIEV